MISKKQVLIGTQRILDAMGDNEKVGKTAHLSKINNKSYWVVPYYNGNTNKKIGNYYIDAETGMVRDHNAL
jgi:hypothetical protein